MKIRNIPKIYAWLQMAYALISTLMPFFNQDDSDTPTIK